MLRDRTIEPDPQALGLQALAWTLADDARAQRFLALTGLDPADLRAAAGQPATLDAVFGFLEAHQPDLVACAEALGTAPDRLIAAREDSPMSRPLLITDCDEVLLHMVVPFAEWLDEVHHIHFDLESGNFVDALRHKATGRPLESEGIWPLLRGFFDTEMHRQYPISGAIEALHQIAETADIVVLTNLTDDERDRRIEQLRAVGVEFPVFTNQGGKGELLTKIVADHGASIVVFVDDLAHNHISVAEHAPDVFRLHMVGEPRLAPQIKTPKAAHARIDDWPSATRWIMDRFAGVPVMTDPKPLTMNPAPPSATIDARLAELGITLPTPAAPVAAYVPTVEANGMLFISGQVSLADGQLLVGRLGEDRDLEFGKNAARACGLMLLAQMKAALGSLDRVERIVKLGVFVNSDPRFTDQPKVADGASQLMVDVFGEAGRHARAAVGAPTLPLGVAVEIDAVVLIKSA